MTFFYDMNKKLQEVLAAPKSVNQQLNERDEGKHNNATTGFKALAAKAAKEYGSKEAGDRVAGAMRNKMKKNHQLEEQDMDEGMFDSLKQGMKKVAKKGLEKLGHGDDEAMRKDLQRKMGVPQTGKKPMDEEYGPMESDAGVPMTPKQKKFAKLAPPADKITFADKIAGAKKEVDEMLGDVAADAMRSAVKGKKKVADEGSDWSNLGKEYSRPKIGSVERGAKHDIEHTATGRRVTRRTDDQGISVGADDEQGSAEPMKRGRGRPKGSSKSIGAKGPSGKSKLMKRESEQELDEKAVSKKQQKFMGMVHAAQKGEKPASKEVAKVAKTMKKKDAEDFASTKHKGLPEKKAKKKEKTEEAGGTGTPTASSGFAYGKGIYDSLNREIENLIAESMQNEAAPKSWQQAADAVGTVGGAALGGAAGGLTGALMGTHVFGPIGMVAGTGIGGLAGIKGGAQLGGNLAKSAVNTVHDAGVGLYRKISAMLGGPEATIAFAKAHIKAAAKDQDSFEFNGKTYTTTMDRDEANQLWQNLGKTNTMDRYDELGYPVQPGVPRNRGLVKESMSINASDSTEDGKSLTITASDEDAIKLAAIIRNAGLGGGGDGHEEPHGEVEVIGIDSPISGDEGQEHDDGACDTCGSHDCGCGDIEEALDENQPDWPTDEVESDDALQYSGGLNGPKSTGQTTVPVIAHQGDRTGVDDEALRRLREMAGLAVTEQEQVMAPESVEEAKEMCEVCEATPCKCDESVEESLATLRGLAGIQEAAKPDYIDLDKDGDKEESMKKAAADKEEAEEKKVEESIFRMTNLWKAYKG